MRADYYPFGMEMPGRKYSSEAYRYDYQGQYAEKDGETGLHHFELRQWDARIARWNSTDPYGQYFSPYMGMGNNPVSLVDPNGGWVPGAGFFKNLFYSDNRINAMNAAGPNGSYFRDPSGGWTANFSDSEGFNIMNFDKASDLSGAYSIGLSASYAFPNSALSKGIAIGVFAGGDGLSLLLTRKRGKGVMMSGSFDFTYYENLTKNPLEGKDIAGNGTELDLGIGLRGGAFSWENNYPKTSKYRAYTVSQAYGLDVGVAIWDTQTILAPTSVILSPIGSQFMFNYFFKE